MTSARNHQILRVNQFTRYFRPNHQLSECFAFNDAYHRPIGGPPPCLKSMAGNNEQHNSNTFPLNAIDRTVNVPFIESGQKYVLIEGNGHIEKVKLGTADS